MMTREEIEATRNRWETDARKAATRRDHTCWSLFLQWVWVLDFVLQDHSVLPNDPGYANNRIPFEPESQEAAQ